MKLTSYLALFAAASCTVMAHSSMKNPLPRGHPLNPNAAVKDTACITAPFTGGPGCAPKSFPCGGYPADTKVTQVLRAGEVINVSFWNPNFPNGPTAADATADQGRHNGGFCEFALSYDGGKTYTVIASYHRTCPDIFFDWPVKIPENAPSCNKHGQCLFSWSWINAVGKREFYQNCADVKIQGNATKPLPIKDITRANFPPSFTNIITPEGDPANTGNSKGSGPQQSDIAINLGSSQSSTGTRVKASPISDQRKADSKAHSTKTAKKTTASKSATSSLTGSSSKGGSSSSSAGSSSSNKTDSSPTAPTGGSCTTNGEMKCVDGSDFTTCVNGGLVTRKCPSGTVCIQVNDSIQCGHQSLKF